MFGIQPKDPMWVTAAFALSDVVETPGERNNPVILQWAKDLGGWIKNFFVADSIPWCALFVNHCLSVSGIKPPNTLAALDYLKWGQPLIGPVLGAVLVFHRVGGGHVGFYLGETDTDYRVLGGNQSDRVGEVWIDKTRLRGIRWPGELATPDPAPILLNATGELRSTDEG